MQNKITYQLKRSNRKTIALHITQDGLEVRAPNRVSQKRIDAFIDSKFDWIQANLEYMHKLKQSRHAFNLDYNTSIIIFGKEFLISASSYEDSRQGVVAIEDKLVVPAGKTSEEIKKIVIAFYKKMSREYLAERVKFHSNAMGISEPTIRITSARTRWGSCNAKGGVNFSWMLMMADKDAIDYVVVHELSHIICHNHSSQFWNIVSKYCPDYKSAKKNLRLLAQRLNKENWKVN